jgi:hypothetical protein
VGGHINLAKAHAALRLIDSVLAHWLQRRPKLQQHEAAIAGQSFGFV